MWSLVKHLHNIIDEKDPDGNDCNHFHPDLFCFYPFIIFTGIVMVYLSAFILLFKEQAIIALPPGFF